MKKIFTLAMTVMALAVLAAPTFAQGRSRRTNDSSYSSQRSSRQAYDNSQSYYDTSGSYYDNSGVYRGSFWERHRDKVTVAAGTAGGAAIGGLIGGKKGAVIGAVAGLGGSALYTYKIRNRGYRY